MGAHSPATSTAVLMTSPIYFTMALRTDSQEIVTLSTESGLVLCVYCFTYSLITQATTLCLEKNN